MKAKKLTSAFIAAAMAITALPQTATAEILPQEAEVLTSGDTGIYNDFEYEELADGTLSITGYVGYVGRDTEIVIPDKIEGKKVTVIGEYAFSDCDSLTKITIPDSVTVIEGYAFLYCENLKTVSIPESVTFIGEYAFSHSGLSSVNISANVTKIGGGAFLGCLSLTYISVDINNKYYKTIDGVLFSKDEKTIIQFPPAKNITFYTVPHGVEKIEDDAFWGNTAVAKIYIPDTVEKIGKMAFSYFKKLTAFDVDENSKYYKDIDGVLFTKNEDTLVQFPTAKKLSAYTVPKNVITIAEGAFGESSLVSIELPDGITTLSDGSFSGCLSLKTINLPDSIVQLGMAFTFCESLTTIAIPEGVSSIGAWTFTSCKSLKSVTVPASVNEIGNWAFYDCPNLTIYGYANSYAEFYAKDNNIPFSPLSDLADSATGIKVTVEEAAVPDGVQLTVTQTSESDTEISFDITLTSNGKEVQPNGNVTVRIPVPEGWDANSIYVYHRDENGRLTEMKATVSDGYIVFTTDHFSEYILTTEKQTTVKLGDVDGNGKINSVDARWVLQAISGKRTLTAEQQAAADVNNDGKINTTDAKWILQAVSGKRELE